MAAPRYIALVSGVKKLIAAITSTAGVGDAEKIVATDTGGRLDPSLMPGGAPVNTTAGAGDAGKLPKLDAGGLIAANMMPGGAPVNTSAGAGDAGKLPKLDAGGKLSQTMMPVGVGPDSLSITASEALSSGNIVNLWNDSGTMKMRKADATVAGKEAHGFVDASLASGAAGTCYFDGQISGLSGLTLGRQFLHTTAGGSTATAPSTAGNVVQTVGVATSATTMTFEPGDPVELA